MNIGSRVMDVGSRALNGGSKVKITAAVVVAAVIVIAGYEIFFGGHKSVEEPAAVTAINGVIELTDAQAQSISVEAASQRVFPQELKAFGSIDFNEDLAVQVFTPYQGRIIQAFAKLGDDVKKGDVLFTIESPDLLNAESALISAAGVLDLTNAALDRTEKMLAVHSAAQKDLEQAQSDQETAEANYKSARDAVFIFGKAEAEVDAMVRSRRVDPQLIVRSPVPGRITARNAQPGLLVQPGNAPAPYTVADLSTVWMVANVDEIDSARYHVGEPVKVTVMAYPGRVFSGQITRLATAVDTDIHRLTVQSEVPDPNHELRPGMFASFVIDTGAPMTSTAAPMVSVIREADGTQTVWVTTDRRHFKQRLVKIGIESDGYRQIIDGLQPGELIATKGALILDNIMNNAGSAS